VDGTDDSRVDTRRVFPKICEFYVKGEEYPRFFEGSRSNLRIGTGEQAFIRCCQHVVSEAGQNGLQMTGQVLVQFQLHAGTAVFQILSWDSSAA